MFAQENRIIHLDTPLGENNLILTSLRGTEGISRLFRFDLNVAWQRPEPVKFADILGKPVTVRIEDEGRPRFINGIVQSVEQGTRDRARDLTYYTLRLAPNTWVLTRNVQSRIFQHKTVPDIVQQVVSDMGMGSTFKLNLRGSYEPRDYCVQYRESDFAFVSRLMESEGIFYFYQHTSSEHLLVLADKGSAFQDLPSAPEIEYEEIQGGIRDKSRIYRWVKNQEIRSGKYAQNDWNFETPSTDLETNETSTQNIGGMQKYEIYEHPGAYMQKSGGESLTKIRLDEENTPGQTARGSSWHSGLCPGYRFTLRNHFSDDGKYIVTGVDHFAEQPLDVGAGEEPFQYSNQFTTVPGDTPYRPERVTPRPRVYGVQTAIVVGPSGEEIYTDKYGRIKVQFHWDRLGANDENSSCWTRVATYWAGKNWGAIHIPRVGQEVIVDFEEGDVDRPIVVGSVYNAMQMPPYSLPAEKTKSTLQSRSSKGGGASNYNEIRFEDKMGSEEIYVQAEKDLNSLVKNDETRKVKHDRTTNIDHDETKTVVNNETITIEQGNQSTTLKQGDQSTTLDMGNQSVRLKMGNQDVKLDLGASTTEAMQSITLKVGESSIVIDQMGVTIKGMMIKLAADMMVQVNGEMMVDISGGITMINS